MIKKDKNLDFFDIFLRIIFIFLLIVFGSKLIWITIGTLTLFLLKLTMFYYPLVIKEYLIEIGRHKLLFSFPCNANYAYLLLVLLILLTKNISFKKGVKLFTAGFLLILIANLLRMHLLIIALVEYSSYLYNTLHMFFWKVLSTIYVSLVWIFLVYKFKIKEIPVYSYLKDFYEKIYKK